MQAVYSIITSKLQKKSDIMCITKLTLIDCVTHIEVFTNYYVKTYTTGYESEQADASMKHLPVLYCGFVEKNIKLCTMRLVV